MYDSDLSLFYIPQGFKITVHGGWMSPNGVYFPLRFGGDEDYVLRPRLNLASYPQNFTNLMQLAYYLGWVKVEYTQSMGGKSKINEGKNTRRTVTLAFSPEFVSNRRSLSVLDIAKIFERRFEKSRLTFRARLHSFSGLDPIDMGDVNSVMYPEIIENIDTMESRGYQFFKMDVRSAIAEADRRQANG